jgi:hypothetical protein
VDNEAAVTSLSRRWIAGAAAVIAAALCFGVASVRLDAHQTVISPFTYSKDVRPILLMRCGSCHADLLNYEGARRFPFGLQRVLLSGMTTPSLADGVALRPEHQALSMIEFDTLMTWSAGGTPEEGVKPHMPHRGEHGGMFVAGAGDAVHLEAVFQEQRRFRVYVSDPSGAPLGAEQLRALQVRVGVAGVESALATSADGPYLEARIATQSLPATFTLIVKASAGGEQRLNLTFGGFSVEPVDATVPPTVIPKTTPGVLVAIQEQTNAAEKLAAAGGYGQLYIPASHLRELLLAMPPHRSLEKAMRATWLVHLSGDDGSPAQSRAATGELRKAIDQLTRSVGR